jgi:hypothetical protein
VSILYNIYIYFNNVILLANYIYYSSAQLLKIIGLTGGLFGNVVLAIMLETHLVE